ncbi:MAG: hypothetical protein ACR2GY_01965 [Phycisphaerales bacterium]
MTTDQLRKALHELDGHRDLRIVFERTRDCTIRKALLIPEEEDAMIKVTDGSRVFVIDAHRVAWIIIGNDVGEGSNSHIRQA